jgi:hypothetical protein
MVRPTRPALDRMSGGVWGWWWVHTGRARHERSTHAHSEERARSDARAARRIVRNFTSLHMPRSLLAIVTFAVLCSPPPRSVRGDLLPARPLLPRPPTHNLTAWLTRDTASRCARNTESLFPRRADKIRVGMNVDRQNTNGSTWCGRHVP